MIIMSECDMMIIDHFETGLCMWIYALCMCTSIDHAWRCCIYTNLFSCSFQAFRCGLQFCSPTWFFATMIALAAAPFVLSYCYFAGGWDMQWEIRCCWLHNSEQWWEHWCEHQCFIRCQQLHCHSGLSKCTKYLTRFSLQHQCYCLYWH